MTIGIIQVLSGIFSNHLIGFDNLTDMAAHSRLCHAWVMSISYKRHRFPAEIISSASGCRTSIIQNLGFL